MTFPIPPTGVGAVIATQTLTIRKTDRLPSIVVQIIDEFGNAIDITGFQAWLKFRLVEGADGSGPWSEGTQTTVADATQGIVSYDWQLSDTNNAVTGIYEFTINIINPTNNSLVFTAPTTRDSFINIRSAVVASGFSDLYLSDKYDALALNQEGAYAQGDPDTDNPEFMWYLPGLLSDHPTLTTEPLLMTDNSGVFAVGIPYGY